MGRKFLVSVVMFDIAAFAVSIFAASWLVYGTPPFWTVELAAGASIWPMVGLLTLAAAIQLALAAVSRTTTVPRPSYGRAVAFVGFTVVLTSVGMILSRAYYSRPFIISFAVVWLALTLSQRAVRRARPWQDLFVFVTSEKELVADLQDAPHVTIVAVLDPSEESPAAPIESGVALAVDLRAVLSESMAQYVSSASISGTGVRPFASVYEEHTGRIPMVHLAEGWELSQPVSRSSYAPIKRVLDVFLVAVTLPLWLSVCGVVAIVVRLDSRGPILYRQERVGRDHRRITLTKFRTMVVGAEPEGPQFAAPDDPRITRAGRFLRKSRLDEFPQLWGVLKGDLSLIGPRPERPIFVKEYAAEIPFYDSRHLVRPGVTGWAQVNYGYADHLAETIEKLTYDLFYIKHSSFWLDAQIIGKSWWTVLSGFGAR
jgi:lipopolysaccharide/colanic/teichoic acid biosynthesis glycosyltransferase